MNTINTALNAAPPPANAQELRTNLGIKNAALTAKNLEIVQAERKIQDLTAAAKPASSKRFIDDILLDDGGVSFHRFQMFSWTIVLILIFFVSVYRNLAMPEFDATLLGLMGISAGTYIGFKLPTQQG